MAREVQVQCEGCGHSFAIRHHRRLRVIAAGAGALVGAVVTESVVGVVVIGGISYAVARAADNYWARRCPRCGTLSDLPAAKVQPAEAAAA